MNLTPFRRYHHPPFFRCCFTVYSQNNEPKIKTFAISWKFLVFFLDLWTGLVVDRGREGGLWTWCWEQGEVRLVMPSSYYYQYCMNGGEHIGQRR